MLNGLYRWTMGLAAHPRADRALALVSFVESSIFPIPPDTMLLPMVLARPERAWYFAGVCTVASVLGAVMGYALGYFAFDAVGRPIFEAYGYIDEFSRFQTGFNAWGAWLVFIFGVTFFPFKVITIASGVVAMDPWVFLLAAALSRAPRFFLEAALLWRFGAPIERFIEKRLGWLLSLFAILLVGGFLAIKLL